MHFHWLKFAITFLFKEYKKQSFSYVKGWKNFSMIRNLTYIDIKGIHAEKKSCTSFTFKGYFMWCLMCNVCTQIRTVLYICIFPLLKTGQAQKEERGSDSKRRKFMVGFFFLLGCKFRVLTGTQIYVFDIRNQLANVKNNMYPTRSLSQVELNKILKWYTRKGIYIEYFLIFGVNRKYTKI